MKLWLAILAPAMALLWIAWHVVGRDDRVYSSGRLSAAHAVLEKECAACQPAASWRICRNRRGFCVSCLP